MLPDSLEVYLRILPILALVGLVFDIIGAIAVLGPNLEPIARAMTFWDRRKLKNLVSKLEREGRISVGDSSFQYLRIAVGQSHKEGRSHRPATFEEGDPMDFFWNFDIAEKEEARLTFREMDGGRQFHYNMPELKKDVENFTATAKDYYWMGLFLFISGFFLQGVNQLATISEVWSLIVFIVIGSIISILGYVIQRRHMPSAQERIKSTPSTLRSADEPPLSGESR